MMKCRKLDNPQEELLLLRNCTGAPKLIYWLRNSNPSLIAQDILAFDKLVDDSLKHIIGQPLTWEERTLAHLPLSMGGLGIPIAAWIAPAAFVSSIGSSWSLQNVSTPRSGFDFFKNYLTSLGVSVPVLPPKNCLVSPLNHLKSGYSQANLMLDLNKLRLSELQLNLPKRTQVLITGQSCKAANYWITACPNTFSRTTLTPAVFRMLLKYHLGIPILSYPQPCPDCHKLMDVYGDHAMVCPVSSNRIDKHDSIAELLFENLKKAGLSVCLNVGKPEQHDGSRPGDIYLSKFDNLGESYFDISIINILCPSHLARASKGQLQGSDIRYKEKLKKYSDLKDQLKPLIIENTGGWHPKSFETLKSLSELIAHRTNQSTKDVLNSLLLNISVNLQRDQGAMVVRRCQGLA
jgi:hypothetical protein